MIVVPAGEGFDEAKANEERELEAKRLELEEHRLADERGGDDNQQGTVGRTP